MLFYILRRLVAVVIMLIITSIATFLLFFAAPRIRPGSRAARTARRPPSRATAGRSGTTSRSPCSTASSSRASSWAATTPTTPPCAPLRPSSSCTARHPASATRGSTTSPVTRHHQVGAAHHGVHRARRPSCCGSSPACPGRHRRRPHAGADGPTGCIVGIALIGFSLPTFFIGLLLLVFVAIKWQLVPVPSLRGLHREPGRLGPATRAALRSPSPRSSRPRTCGSPARTCSRPCSEDYIRTARSKGVREWKVIGRHGLRAALTPIVTAAGLDLGGLLGGAIITETVFTFPGLGLHRRQGGDRLRPAADRRDRHHRPPSSSSSPTSSSTSCTASSTPASGS